MHDATNPQQIHKATSRDFAVAFLRGGFVAPTVGISFEKINCFCLTTQTMQPGKARDMPVVFSVDPKLAKGQHNYAFLHLLPGARAGGGGSDVPDASGHI
jgi:hypothetical protein